MDLFGGPFFTPKATLAIEQLQLNEEGLSEIESLVKGDISREEFQRKLKEKYQTHEEL